MKLVTTSFAAAVLTSTALVLTAQAQTAQQPAEQTAAQAEQQPVTVARVVNQQVFTGNGKQAGRVIGAIRDNNGMYFLVVTMNQEFGNRQVYLPATNVMQQSDRLVISGLKDAQLRQLTPYQSVPQEGVRQLETSAELQLGSSPAGAAQAQASTRTQDRAANQNQGEGASIVVQQEAPTIRVQPAQPQVTVQQATPQVSVVQPQPEIIVRQAPPTITVDMPQPEIIVRMPEPDVNVSMAQPQVQVRVPQPQVQVVQPEQPQLQVQGTGQAQVQVRQPAQQAQVNVQRVAPQVRFERTGEPRIVMNEAQGEPQIRFEQMGEANAGTAGQQGTAGQNQTVVQQNNVGEVTGSTGQATEGQAAVGTQAEQQMRPLRMSELRGQEVYNLRGDNLGTVSDILLDQNDGVHVIMEYGGFLGLGEQRVMLPVDRFAMGENNRLVIPRMSEDQLRALPAWDRNMEGYSNAAPDFESDIALWR